MKKQINKILLFLLIAIAFSCSKDDKVSDPIVVDPVVPESQLMVDYNQELGNVMNLTAFNGSSTTSPIPGAVSQTWLQKFQTKVTRVWIQLRFVYNNGNLNYNYKYDGSKVPVEDALQFYSTTSDSLLVALSGHTASSSYTMPEGNAYVDFVKETVLHYKRKYPKIKYIQVSNEPDLNNETMATYYPVYKYYYRAINAANQVLKNEATIAGKNYSPILISNGAFTSNVTNMLDYANSFFKAYVADTEPTKRLDFFSFNNYAEADRPKQLLDAKKRIDSAMVSNNMPKIPVFISEFGAVGGSSLPSNYTLQETVTMWPAAQLTKAFYLYEGGVNAVFNWVIHHSTLAHKSQLLDINNAFASPYGNTMVLSKMLSDYGLRIHAESKLIDSKGIGVHVLAAKKIGEGIGILVWNYNWRYAVADKSISISLKNIPNTFPADLKAQVYLIDSKNNNFFLNNSQKTLTSSLITLQKNTSDYQIPLKLEKSAVALIVINEK